MHDYLTGLLIGAPFATFVVGALVGREIQVRACALAAARLRHPSTKAQA